MGAALGQGGVTILNSIALMPPGPRTALFSPRQPAHPADCLPRAACLPPAPRLCPPSLAVVSPRLHACSLWHSETDQNSRLRDCVLLWTPPCDFWGWQGGGDRAGPEEAGEEGAGPHNMDYNPT